MYKFAPASEHEPIVFGAAKPRCGEESVYKWIEFMQKQDIKRVCCLLAETQLTSYTNLLEIYRQTFGIDRVCWAPIADFRIANPNLLKHQILPFLAIADQRGEKVVVHCGGGIGRTGHILAAWLVAGRGFAKEPAIAAVRQTGRNPREAVTAALLMGRNPWNVAEELNRLLDECHRYSNQLALDAERQEQTQSHFAV